MSDEDPLEKARRADWWYGNFRRHGYEPQRAADATKREMKTDFPAGHLFDDNVFASESKNETPKTPTTPPTSAEKERKANEKDADGWWESAERTLPGTSAEHRVKIVKTIMGNTYPKGYLEARYLEGGSESAQPSTTKESKPVATKAKDIEVLASPDTLQIILPTGMTHASAREWLQRDEERLQKVVAISRKFNSFVLDGAYAFARAISEIFGFSEQVPTPGFFGSSPPQMVSMDVGLAKPVLVPWGRIAIPGIDGFLQTHMKEDQNGFPQFVVTGEIRVKDKAKVEKLLDRTESMIKESSIYRGRAIRVRFRDDDGQIYEEFRFDMAPTFMNPGVVKTDLIFDDTTKREIQDYVFTPIEQMEVAHSVGVPIKRGILLEGTYGVGKTMVGAALATIAEQKKVTYVEVNDARDLHRAMDFAKRYAPAIVWAEDIEKAVGVDRDSGVDQILNTVDGVDSKNHKLMIVVTTNHIEKINSAMKRPGRFDAIIHISEPDEKAALQLVKLYGRGRVNLEDLDMPSVGKALSGKIPALIRECVERAKLSAITRTQSAEFMLTADDLLLSATSLDKHLEAMKFRPEERAIHIGMNIDGEMLTGSLS